MSELKVVQAEYKGYNFRSLIKARWAVFFDTLGVKWKYEPEGHNLGNGVYYLSECLLHDVTINHGLFQRHCDIYVEVEGVMTDEDARKIIRFSKLGYKYENRGRIPKTAVLVVGNIPIGESMGELIWNIKELKYFGNPLYYNFETIDGDYFASYLGVDKNGTLTLFGDDSNYSWSVDVKDECAYRIARQARFEYRDSLE